MHPLHKFINSWGFRLKVTNLGPVVTDLDLKAYFVDVKKVIRPRAADPKV